VRPLVLVVLLLAAGCSGHEHAVSGFGLKLDLPRGWTGEVYGRGKGVVILQPAATASAHTTDTTHWGASERAAAS
jgi:hypothetical protein